VLIRVKRVYERRSPDDGLRVLVDRLWPRGLSRTAAGVDLWVREVAPSNVLRKWFGHNTSKWEEFKRRYHGELASKQQLIGELLTLERKHGTVTLLYSARDTEQNNAVALMEYLRLQRGV